MNYLRLIFILFLIAFNLWTRNYVYGFGLAAALVHTIWYYHVVYTPFEKRLINEVVTPTAQELRTES
jgi:hypothetical protein